MKVKITKTKIQTFFTYDFWKVVAISVLVCFVLVICINCSEEKPTLGQEFTCLYSEDIILGEDSATVLYYAGYAGEPYAFSYDITNIKSRQIQAGDQGQESSLSTFVDLYEDDIFICTDSLASKYLESSYAQSFESYVNGAFEYLYSNNFYSRDGVINETAIVDNFVNNYKKDNRFKTEENINLGKELEIARIKTLYSNATILKNVIENHAYIFSDTLTKYEWAGNTFTGKFAIELGKLKGGEYNVLNGFQRKVKNSETGEVSHTADGVYLFIGFNAEQNGHLHYESMAYIIALLKMYTNII